jgi:hypothetical protein
MSDMTTFSFSSHKYILNSVYSIWPGLTYSVNLALFYPIFSFILDSIYESGAFLYRTISCSSCLKGAWIDVGPFSMSNLVTSLSAPNIVNQLFLDLAFIIESTNLDCGYTPKAYLHANTAAPSCHVYRLLSMRKIRLASFMILNGSLMNSLYSTLLA